MYVCEIHGRLESGWCDECEKTISCNCEDRTFTRFKGLIYDCKEGERTITIYLDHCETCGNPIGVRI